MAAPYQFSDTKYGRMAVLSNDTYVSRSLLHYGEWTELELDLISQVVKTGSTIADIGANIGSHTLPFARLVGERGCIYAFEPQPRIFELLAANVVMNELPQVRLFNAGCGKQRSFMRIVEVERGQALNHGAMSLEFLSAQTGIAAQLTREIEIVRFDDVFQHSQLSFLKIDIEGMETEAILGAQRSIERFRPIMYVENDRLPKSEVLMNTLFDLNYDCYWHITPCFNPRNFRNAKDNIFPSVLSFNMLCIPKERPTNINGLRKIEKNEAHPLANRKEGI